MSVPTIKPAELETLRRRGEAVELDRRADAGRVPGSPRRTRSFDAARSARSQVSHGTAEWLERPSALRDLPHGEKGSNGRREVSSRRVHQCRERRGWDARLGARRPGSGAWREGGVLERQVQIAAGSLVVTGTVLGMFVHPFFVGLSAFVGLGLVFSGITNTCGMGLVLARMPWNRAAADGAIRCD